MSQLVCCGRPHQNQAHCSRYGSTGLAMVRTGWRMRAGLTEPLLFVIAALALAFRMAWEVAAAFGAVADSATEDGDGMASASAGLDTSRSIAANEIANERKQADIWEQAAIIIRNPAGMKIRANRTGRDRQG